ncbi:PREDICTED: uncharacterized protein LOC101299608 [Fragaria vesca subsp. vesca]
MVHILNKEEVDMLFMFLWAIWEERNRLLWNGGSFNPRHVAMWSMKLLQEYQFWHPLSGNWKLRSRSQKWVAPPSGRLKLNCDGAYNINTGCGGVGMIIRGVGGTFVAAWSKHFSHLRSALHSEVEACRASLQIAIDQGWRNIEMESDSVAIVTALNNREFLPYEVSRILEDCIVMIQSFEFFRIWHIHRKANGVADRLAHFVSRGHVVDLMVNEAPDFIQDVLFIDSCNGSSTQGVGTDRCGVFNVNAMLHYAAYINIFPIWALAVPPSL